MAIPAQMSAYWCAPRLLKVSFCSWILLLWLTTIHLATMEDEQDKKLAYIISLPILVIILLTYPLILYVGGCLVSLEGSCNAAFKPMCL